MRSALVASGGWGSGGEIKKVEPTKKISASNNKKRKDLEEKLANLLIEVENVKSQIKEL